MPDVLASTCPACGASAFASGADGSGTCERCGYASGEGQRCPHCKAVARIEGVGQQAVCAVCGGPRITANYGGGEAFSALRDQKRQLGAARLASIATVTQGLFAVLATLIALALQPSSLVAKGIAFAFALVPLLLAIRSRSRATSARAAAKASSERAWQAAAEDVTGHAKDGITVPALAKTLAIEPEDADRLLTSLAVHDRTRIDVGDDAEVRYSVAPQNSSDGLLDEIGLRDEEPTSARSKQNEARIDRKEPAR